MKIMTIINPINKRSTLWSSIFLLIFLPQNPPRIPPAAINARSAMEKAGIVAVTIEFSKLVIWENNIIYREFCAAVLVGMEKKKNNTTKLIGPPPMPRNEDITPRTRPTSKQTIRLATRSVFTFALYMV